MLRYYFMLGLRNLRHNPALTALMVLTLAIGVAASVSTLTILHVMSSDPIPTKSSRLFVPLVDNAPIEGFKPGDEPDDDQLSYKDAVAFLNSNVGERRSVMFGVFMPVEPPRKDLDPFQMQGLAPSHDFFAMFDVPFRYGQAWGEAEDKAGADVVILSRTVSEKIFGNANPVGQQIRIRDWYYTIVGVTDTWKPMPRYYKLIGGNGYFGDSEEFFIPFSSAIRHESGHNGNMNCTSRHEPGYQALLDSECTWIQFWFEMKSASDRGELQSWLDGYAEQQRKLGRLKRNQPNMLYDVNEWLVHLKVVGNDNRLSAWLAFGFLLLCLVNTIGLLLAKFSVRSSEIGVRRALGASRREIFTQFLMETTVVGLAGGIAGLLLAFGALALIAMQSKEMATVAHMDWMMLAFTFVMSVLAATLAGLLPTWRACQVTPALQLKSQ